MSDRVLVVHNGQAQQVGTPREIYEAPRNLFVAQFIGEINDIGDAMKLYDGYWEKLKTGK